MTDSKALHAGRRLLVGKLIVCPSWRFRVPRFGGGIAYEEERCRTNRDAEGSPGVPRVGDHEGTLSNLVNRDGLSTGLRKPQSSSATCRHVRQVPTAGMIGALPEFGRELIGIAPGVRQICRAWG